MHQLIEKLLAIDSPHQKNVYNFKILNSFSDGVEEAAQMVLTLFCHILIKCLLSTAPCRRNLIVYLPGWEMPN